MIRLKRHILATTCLVFMFPHAVNSAESEHERYVPKVVLDHAKSKLEEQAKSMGGHGHAVLEHVSVAEPIKIKTIRVVGPIVDFEKAAGFVSKPKVEDMHDARNHASDVSEVSETIATDAHKNTSDMHESKIAQPHSNGGGDAHAEEKMHGENDDKHGADASQIAHDSDEHLDETKQPEMFKSVIDEQHEKAMADKKSMHGDVEKHKEVISAGKKAVEFDLEGNPTKFEFVFKIVEVPVELSLPTQEIRALQQLQDGLVIGKEDSFKKYRVQLKKSVKILISADAKTWNYKKNIDAVALFTLIGGDPRVGKLAKSKTNLSKDHTLYLDAALAYSTGRLGVAFNLFKKIDFKHIPISTAAQFAIVKSMLYGRVDAKLAKDYLDLARKIAPGTLAEEASLRRLIRMSSDEGNVKLFTRVSSIYAKRYKNSFYFNDFLKNYSYSLVRMPKSAEGAILKNLKSLSKSLKPNQQLAVSSYVSGIATELGMFKLSGWTAKKALSLSRQNGKLHTRMKLYHLASTVTELDGSKTMMSMVEGINDELLNSKDKFLYDNVIALSQRIYNDPMTQSQIRNGIKVEADKFSHDDPTIKLFKESVEFAQKNATIKKSIDILDMSEKVLNGESL